MNKLVSVPVLMFVTLAMACAPKANGDLKAQKPEPTKTVDTPATESPDSEKKKIAQVERAEEPPVCPAITNTLVDPDAKVRKTTMFLHRITQKVTRKNCDGQVISERMETIISPDREIDLKPTRWLGVRPFVASIQNRTTCSATGENLEHSKEKFITVFGTPMTHFKVSMVPLSEAITVNDGLNYVDYQFAHCDQETNEILPNSRGDGKICTKWHILEKGTILLDVYYGETEIREPRVLVDCTDRI